MCRLSHIARARSGIWRFSGVVAACRMRYMRARCHRHRRWTGPRAATATRFERYIRDNDVEFLFAQFVDMHGEAEREARPGARTSTTCSTDGAGFAGFAAGDIGQRPQRPRPRSRCPTSASFTPLPWQPGVARFACDVYVEGEEWPYCPRTILRRQLERAAALGYEFKIGAELEYFLVRKRDDGSIELADPLDTLDAALLRHARADPQPRLRVDGRAGTSPRSAGTTTPPTTRTPTASSSRTSSSPTR